MKKIFLTAIIIFALSAPMFVSAQGLKGALGTLENIGGKQGEKIGVSADLATTVATVIKTVLALVGTIFLVLTIYAGIMWMTAQGNEEQVTKAVGIIKASVVGLIIIMSAYAITYFVTSKLGGVAGTSSTSNQTGCCYTADYSVCAANNVQSNCNTNSLWQAGACPPSCP